MVTTKLNLSMTEPQVRQIYAKQGDTGRVLDITLDQTPEDGTLRILRPDGTEVTSEAVTGGEVESGSSFDSLTEADVTELTVGIEPVQDLNGYDAPWVGGAGKNLLDPSKVTPRSGGTYGLTVTYSNDIVRIQGTPTSQSASLTFNFITYADDSLSGKGYVVQAFNVTGTPIKNLYGFRNATEQVCAIMFDSVANPTVDCSFKLSVASTSQTAWQPYSNICPITGHDEVTVFDTAEQMYDPSQVVIGRNWTGGSADNRAVFEFVPTPNVSYEIVTVGGNFSDILFLQMNNGTILSNTGILPSRTPMTITIADNCNRVIIQFNKDSAITTSDFLDFECSVSTKTNTYTTSLGQTVYGGTLDMASGVLTVTHAMVDMGSLPWLLNSSLNGKPAFYVRLDDAKTVSASSVADMTTSCYSVISADNLYIQKDNTGIIALNGQNYLQVRDTRYSTASDYKSGITGQQLVYELATPLTYTLTAQQIKTLVGTNNVWASSGDIVSITFTYGGLLSELPSEATEIVGKCYCDIEQNGVSSMPFTLNVKKNERQ